MKFITALFILLVSLQGESQDLSARELLEKTIAYHDPNGQWPDFNDTFNVTMTMPNRSKRESVITISLPEDYFSVQATKDSITTTYIVEKTQCILKHNGQILDSTAAAIKQMSCDRARLYKNYYTYLFGLPMKLKDPGTNLSEQIKEKTFKGKDYLVLKVSYDKAVGSDIWYFYFNPLTYAMEVYQFFKTDANGKEKPDSGEYILLSEEAIIHGIKMPKIRAWFYNKDGTYLGTDTLD